MLDNLLNHFTLITKIGEGSFSEVLKVKDKKTGRHYAAKRLTKPFVNLDEAMNCAELKTLQKLEYHPNVLSLVDFVFEPNNGMLTLILDLMDMSMYDYIKNRRKALSETRCKHYMFQLVQGLNHLHRSGIFHRDIKPENILIRMDPRMKTNPLRSELVQLADLGSVCRIDNTLPHSAYISTRWYRAPECLLTSGYYGAKMDVWALGCCFYEFLTLNPLFPGDNELDQLHKIHEIVGTPAGTLLDRFKNRNVKFDFPKKKAVGFHNLVPMLSDYGVDVLKKTLVYHPDCRVSAKKLMEHSYFEELRSKNRVNTVAAQFLMSTSLTSSPTNSRQSTSRIIASGRASLNSSRGSSFSNGSGSKTTMQKLQDAQQCLNKQLERGWGMNTCPRKDIFIKSTVQQKHKSMIL